MELAVGERAKVQTQEKIFNVEETGKLVKELKEEGKVVGSIEGVWDIFGIGYLKFIEFAKNQCDVLVVLVSSDQYARANKGEGRPVYNQYERSRVLAAVNGVDIVCLEENPPALFGTEEYENYMRYVTQTIHPDKLIVSTKADAGVEIKKTRAASLDIEFVPYNREPDLHTTQLLQKLEEVF